MDNTAPQPVVNAAPQQQTSTQPANGQPSSRIARIAAYYVDGFVIFIVLLLLQGLLNALKASSLVSIITYVFSFGYFLFFTVKSGATPGKKFFGLKVINSDGSEKVSVVKAFLREVVGKFISGLVLGLGYLWILWDGQRQGWHDKIASTLVLQVTPLGGMKKALAWIIVLLFPLTVIIGIASLFAILAMLGLGTAGQFIPS